MRYLQSIGIAIVGVALAGVVHGSQALGESGPGPELLASPPAPEFTPSPPSPVFRDPPPRSCGTISAGRVVEVATTCARARTVVRYAVSHRDPITAQAGSPPGWRCLDSTRSPAVTRLVMSCARSGSNARARLFRR